MFSQTLHKSCWKQYVALPLDGRGKVLLLINKNHDRIKNTTLLDFYCEIIWVFESHSFAIIPKLMIF